jgi:hypothetical protein
VKYLKSEWLLKGLVESFFVVGSILLALAVDSWSENRDFAELADQSLGIFEQEILRNRAALEEVSPFHEGIRDLLAQMLNGSEVQAELKNVMEGLETPVLLNTAWETAMATGALTHIDMQIVSALSLTYSIQERFGMESRTLRPPPTPSSRLSASELDEGVRAAHDYMVSLTRGESELMTVLGEALELIRAHRGTTKAGVSPREVAHP